MPKIEQFLMAARKRTHGPRDFLPALLAYRHGFRVSELIERPNPSYSLYQLGMRRGSICN